MARHKEFDEGAALRSAITAFGRNGFAATSTDDLLSTMGIGRQSMYDTFGDKRALFLGALALYTRENLTAIAAELRGPGPALVNIRNAMMSFTQRNDIAPADGCMGINSLCEFGLRDEEVLNALEGEGAAKEARRLLLATLRRAKAEGELSADASISALADFFDMTLAGLRLSAKGGKTRSELRNIVEVALTAFK